MHSALPLTLLVLFSNVEGTTWGPARQRIFSSSYYASEYAFKLLPQVNGKDRTPAQGELFRLESNGQMKTIWRAKLLSNPHQVYVSPQGHVVTLDTYGAASDQHALVIYSRQGKVLADFSFEQIAPDKTEISNIYMGKPMLSTVFKPDMEWLRSGLHFVLRDEAGKALVFSLATGKRVR